MEMTEFEKLSIRLALAIKNDKSKELKKRIAKEILDLVLRQELGI